VDRCGFPGSAVRLRRGNEARHAARIGAVEILGAIGLILPQALDIAPVLTPLAATGLAVIQVGAIIVHGRRKETKALPMNVVLLVLAAFVAVGRFAG
jgi:hypothetical protein